MLPSSIELTYFYEIALSSSFSHAARKLNITQPSLSMAIKRLESSLKTTLFYRHKSGVSLTRTGETLFHQVKDLILRWDIIKLHVQAIHQEIKGRVTIGCNSILTPFIAKIISQLLNKYAGLEIHLVSENSQKITEMVTNTSVDIGIVINPAEHADLIIKKILNTDFTFWTAHNDVSAVQTFDSGEAVIICDANIPQTHQLLKELSNKNLSYARVSTANNQETIANLAISGCGIAILSYRIVAALYSDKLKRIENAPSCRNSTCIIFRKENKEIAAIKIVINTLKEYVAKFLSPSKNKL